MNVNAPWWIVYLFIGAYFTALTYGWLVVDKVTTSDYFIQFGLLMAAAFGVQINPQKKKGSVDIEADNVDVTETP